MNQLWNLNGSHIPVVGLRDLNYEIQLKSVIFPNGSVEFVDGFSYEILTLLQSSLNFTYSPVNGEGWIDQLPNGTWTGIGRQVFDGEAVLSITSSSMIPYRLQAFAFLFPMALERLTVTFLQPSSHSIRNLVYSIFTFTVWMSGFLIAASAVALLKVIAVFRKWKLVQLEEDDEGLLQEPTFCILITFCQRGLTGKPSSLSVRLVYVSIVVTSLVGYIALSASLVSVLSTELVPIRSFGDLLRSDLDLLGDSSTPYTHSIMQGLNKNRKKGQESVFTDVRRGVRAVLDRGTSYATYEESLLTVYRAMNLTDEFLCKNVVHFELPGLMLPTAMFVKKGSPFKEPINVKLGVLNERGLLSRLQKKWYTSTKVSL